MILMLLSLNVVTQAKPNPAFKSIVSTLQSKTKVPVLLPSFIPQTGPGTPVYIETIAHRSYYEIHLAYAQDYQQSTACNLGNIKGELTSGVIIAPDERELPPQIITLKSGTKAYFFDATCGASCSNSDLIWDQGGYRYTVSIKAAKLKSLVDMANSMKKLR